MKFNIDEIPKQEGKIAIVTGANNGVGFETTAGLARTGYEVIMACRNPEKAQRARDEILRRNPGARLEILPLDLSRPESVREFAGRFRAKHDKLNLLINNAGVLDYSGRRNEEGIELQFATNHLGHFLLTSLLLDLMPDTDDSRIVSLSSVAHKKGQIHFDDINCENTKAADAAYCQSKLACLMFSDELHRRLVRADRKVLSVCAHPGGTDSGLFDDMSRIQYFALKMLAPIITHSNEDAAKPSLYAALMNDVRGGDYYGPQGLMELKGPPGIAARTEYSKDAKIAARLWELSEKVTGTTFEIGKPAPAGQ